jgi:two-component system cell cycle response regulator
VSWEPSDRPGDEKARHDGAASAFPPGSLPPPERADVLDAPARILVVDDDRLGARMVSEMLRGLGHEPTMATNWTTALAEFRRAPPDLVLMDAIMPTVDGFKLTRMLREGSREYVPIVFLTGLQDREARQRGIDAGADDFLIKPVDELLLQMRLNTMLRVRRLTHRLEEHSRHLSRLAKIDPLTGLFNRRVLDERLPRELRRTRRYRRPLSALMLDVDHFKRVNDTYGHDVGDVVLVFLGELLKQQLRDCDEVFRYGGEEFFVLLPETPRPGAREVAERLRRVFEERSPETPAGPQTLSIGVAALADLPGPADALTLLQAADAALYAAKEGGRNQVRWHRAVDEAAKTLPPGESPGEPAADPEARQSITTSSI